jgi:hypothetical protein
MAALLLYKQVTQRGMIQYKVTEYKEPDLTQAVSVSGNE